jgi:hypothetical protein
MLDFTLLGNCSMGCSTSCILAVVTPALSNKRGSLVLLQLIVFIMRKGCVDTYALIPVIKKFPSSPQPPKREVLSFAVVRPMAI